MAGDAATKSPRIVIVSGGQTGADRAALDFAAAAGIAYRGWVPRGRLAEDGVISADYVDLVECDSEDPAVRTRLNVRDSDGMVILAHGPPAGGTALAAAEAVKLHRPCLQIDLAKPSLSAAANQLRQWLEDNAVSALNVAGPRHSEDPRIYATTIAVLALAIYGR